MYEFSISMLYDKNLIDKIVELNNRLTKCKITSFYDSLSVNSDFVTGLEQHRGENPQANTLDKFLDYVKYAIDNGFKFIYLLNATTPIDMRNHIEYKKVTNNIDVLVKKLKDIGCNTFRVGNTSTIDYLCETYPNIEIFASTSMGYTEIGQYKNIVDLYPNIKELCLNYLNNKNFKLLKNLNIMLPDVKKEVMVNEICIKDCPLRNSHYSVITMHKNNPSFVNYNVKKMFMSNCRRIAFNDFWLYVCKSSAIYPWFTEIYSKYGINKFKIIGRFYDLDIAESKISYIEKQLESIESSNPNLDIDIFSFFNSEYSACYKGLMFSDVKKYLPDISYFEKHGHLCSSECGIECNYCYEKAKVLNEKFPLDKYRI